MGLHRARTGEPLAAARRCLGRPKSDQAEKNMDSTFQRIKVYTKLFFICVVILAAVIFIWSNTELVAISFLGWKVKVWAWLLVVLAGLTGILVFLIICRSSSLLRDVRRLRSDNKTRNQSSPNADSPSQQ